MYGGQGGIGLAEVVNNPETYGIEPTEIHSEAVVFEQIKASEFCMPCHQVAVHPGIKLEVVWDQYRSSPAAKLGITCQDCHMGKTPGTHKDGYATSSRARVSGVDINPGSRHGDHSMVGPGYSTAHPGIFPHNIENDDEKFTIRKWMTFNWREEWGSADFEGSGSATTDFPEEWSNSEDRVEAWRIVEQNIAELNARMPRRKALMEIGSRLDGPFFANSPRVGERFSFHYEVHNIDEGHNFPSGSLGAQPEIWLNVALIDPAGKNIWESGYVDSEGDLADLQSADVPFSLAP